MATSSLATTFGLQFYPDETTATTTGGVVGGGGGSGGAVDPLAARPPVAGLPVQSSNAAGNSAAAGQQQPMYATSANRSTSPLNSQNHLAHPFHMSFPVTQTHNISKYHLKIVYLTVFMYHIIARRQYMRCAEVWKLMR